MDSKKLEALAAAVEYGSFTRAAQQLGYTQSGLTHMMNSLEREIGFPVLVRDRWGVRLTPSGQRIMPMVQQCLTANQSLEREISLINSHQEDTIRVASYASIAMHWLPEIIQRFRDRGIPSGKRRRERGCTDGFCGGGIPLGAGGQSRYGFCQPAGEQLAGLDAPQAGSSAGDPAPEL